MNPKELAQLRVAETAAAAVELSHSIHSFRELGFAETRSAELLCNHLAGAGFRVDRGVCSLPTAFVATLGSGDLCIAICAEYDALPEIGHACGHNIIAAAAVLAGVALAPLADALGITVRVIGTPAEEGGGGKVLMLERGAFEDVHAAMMVHPAPYEDPAPMTMARAHLGIEYEGKAAHASAYPEEGVNAADALTVAQVAVGLLRQQMRSTQRIHGIVTRGGSAPNVIPDHTSAEYYIRAGTVAGLADLERRARACFEAGALATGCRLRTESLSPVYSEFEPDEEMIALYQRNAEALGRTFPIRSGDIPLGSTDMANVSLAVPTIQPMIAIDCAESSNHQPEFARHCAEPSADQAVLDGGLAMAWTAIDLAGDATKRSRLLTRAPTTGTAQAPVPT